MRNFKPYIVGAGLAGIVMLLTAGTVGRGTISGGQSGGTNTYNQTFNTYNISSNGIATMDGDGTNTTLYSSDGTIPALTANGDIFANGGDITTTGNLSATNNLYVAGQIYVETRNTGLDILSGPPSGDSSELIDCSGTNQGGGLNIYDIWGNSLIDIKPDHLILERVGEGGQSCSPTLDCENAFTELNWTAPAGVGASQMLLFQAFNNTYTSIIYAGTNNTPWLSMTTDGTTTIINDANGNSPAAFNNGGNEFDNSDWTDDGEGNISVLGFNGPVNAYSITNAGGYADNTGSLGSSGQVLSSTGTATAWVDVSTNRIQAGVTNISLTGTPITIQFAQPFDTTNYVGVILNPTTGTYIGPTTRTTTSMTTAAVTASGSAPWMAALCTQFP